MHLPVLHTSQDVCQDGHYALGVGAAACRSSESLHNVLAAERMVRNFPILQEVGVLGLFCLLYFPQTEGVFLLAE